MTDENGLSVSVSVEATGLDTGVVTYRLKCPYCGWHTATYGQSELQYMWHEFYQHMSIVHDNEQQVHGLLVYDDLWQSLADQGLPSSYTERVARTVRMLRMREALSKARAEVLALHRLSKGLLDGQVQSEMMVRLGVLDGLLERLESDLGGDYDMEG